MAIERDDSPQQVPIGPEPFVATCGFLDDWLDGRVDQWLGEQREPAYRGRQICDALLRGRIESFGEISCLPNGLRTKLAQQWPTLWSGRLLQHKQSADGTEKLLLEFGPGSDIECVLLRDGPRRTICISSQVGCAMGCVFCASGLEGVKRNLSAGEILEQIVRLRRLLPREERLSHIVVMGMGEPLANLDGVLGALHWAHREQGLGISARRITISTVGLPAGIRRLAAHPVAYQLAVSLHAPNDQLRGDLVPVSRKIGIAPLLQSVDQYFASTGRRVTFEYVLLGGLNDRPEHAQQLAGLLRGRNALVNLIPYNPVSGLPYRTPQAVSVRRFVDTLRARGVQVQVRQTKGDEIDAACGQLRRSHGAATSIDPVAEASQ